MYVSQPIPGFISCIGTEHYVCISCKVSSPTERGDLKLSTAVSIQTLSLCWRLEHSVENVSKLFSEFKLVTHTLLFIQAMFTNLNVTALCAWDKEYIVHIYIYILFEYIVQKWSGALSPPFVYFGRHDIVNVINAPRPSFSEQGSFKIMLILIFLCDSSVVLFFRWLPTLYGDRTLMYTDLRKSAI